MTRLDYNLQILDYLKAYANHYPDMRFGQILSNLNIASHIKCYDEGDQYHFQDIFFPESEETYHAVYASLPVEEWKTNSIKSEDVSDKIVGDNSCFLSIDVSKIPEGVSLEQILDIVKLNKNNG